MRFFNKMILRSFIFLLLIATSVVLPLSVVLLFFVFCVSFFHNFWEGTLVGIFLDSLYFSPNLFANINLGFFTIGFLLVIIFFEKTKKILQGRSILSKVGLVCFGALFLFFYSFYFSSIL